MITRSARWYLFSELDTQNDDLCVSVDTSPEIAMSNFGGDSVHKVMYQARYGLGMCHVARWFIDLPHISP